MPESQFISILPSAEAAARAAKRFALSLPLIEKSSADLLRVHPGPLPDHRDGIFCRVVGIIPTELSDFDSVGVELELNGRDSRFNRLADGFGRIAAHMPVVGGQCGAVRFGLIQASSPASFQTITHHGIPKLQATQRFTAAVDLDGSVFSPDESSDNDRLPIDANRLAGALAYYLADEGISTDFTRRPRWSDGISLAVTEVDGPRFRFRLDAELPADDIRLAALSGLVGTLPHEDFSLCNGVAALALVLAEPMVMSRSQRRSDRVHATLDLDLFVDPCDLDLSGIAPSGEIAPVALPDPVALERKLADLLAIELNLAVNSSIWRGALPPGHDGCAVILAGTEESGGVFAYKFAIQLRNRRRDIVLNQLANLAERFPRFGLWGCMDYRLRETNVSTIAEDGRGKTEAELTTVMRFATNGGEE